MADRSRVHLDSPLLRSRLRPVAGRASHAFDNQVEPVPTQPIPSYGPAAAAVPAAAREATSYSRPGNEMRIVAPQPFVSPAHPRRQSSQVLHRQAVAKPHRLAAHVPPAVEQNVRRRKTMRPILASVGIVLVVLGLVGGVTLLNGHPASNTVLSATTTATPASDTAATPDSSPVEKKPTTATMVTYQVPSNEPRQLIIPKLYAYSRVRAVGLNQKNQLETTGNIFDVGWYSASAKPGDLEVKQAAIIGGHVHGPTTPGVFANLKSLMPGDTFQVVRGDGKILNYSVVKTHSFPYATFTMQLASALAIAGKPGLNLIDVNGPYDNVSPDNTQQTVVYAVLSS